MARIKLQVPDTFLFTTQIPIRITDVNYGGHVGNDSVLSILHEIRVQFLDHYHFSEMDFGGTGLIMSDVVIEFKGELFYKDVIEASVTMTDFSRIGFDIFYKLVKKDDTVVVLAKTGMICYDYANKKITAVPQKAKELFQNM